MVKATRDGDSQGVRETLYESMNNGLRYEERGDTVSTIEKMANGFLMYILIVSLLSFGGIILVLMGYGTIKALEQSLPLGIIVGIISLHLVAMIICLVVSCVRSDRDMPY